MFLAWGMSKIHNGCYLPPAEKTNIAEYGHVMYHFVSFLMLVIFYKSTRVCKRTEKKLFECHTACMAKFTKKLDTGKVGRPISEEKASSFEMLCEWLKDGDCELYT